jgi:signal transduction histidine kinase
VTAIYAARRNELPEPPDTDRRSVDDAVGHCIAELTAAIAFHQDDLASISVERTALASQLAQAESALSEAPRGSSHRRMVADAVALLAARLQSADQVAHIASRALRDCESVRDTLVAVSPGAATYERNDRGGRQLFQIIEDERMRIARDMHDGPAQILANLVLKAEIVERLLDHDITTVRSELTDFKAIVRGALDETRRLIFDLRPMTLDDLGLVPTVRNFLSDFEQRWGVECHFTLIGSEMRLPRDREAALFRIMQEGVTNARKHAMASIIDVTISMSPTRVTVTVKDDGQGFDVGETERTAARDGHLGLTSMRERAGLEGALLDISSARNQGTTVRVSVNVGP